VHREDESENSWRWRPACFAPVLEEALAGAEREPGLFEIGLRQVGQNVRLDLVLKEDPLVLAKSEALSQAPMSMIVSLSAREG